MASQGVFPVRPAAGATAPPQAWPTRPKYALADIPAMLWRERRLMLTVFVAVMVLGTAFALSLAPVYAAHSSLLARLGQEYVYQPRAGEAGQGAVPDNDHVLQSESEILGSDALKLRLVRHIGVARLAPGLAGAYAAGAEDQRQRIEARLAESVGRALKIETATGDPVIRVSYQNRDPQLAAQVLNALLEEFLVYRRTVLLAPSALAFEGQRKAFQQRLDQADAAYQDFLSNNRIGDFEAEKTSLSQLAAQLEQQQYVTQSSIEEKGGRLAAIEGELAALPPEVGLYHDADVTASAKLADLKVQREGLLARYRPEARPVADLDAQIAKLEAAIAAGRTQSRGPERTGLNPVYQTFETERLQLGAEVAALKETAAVLDDQMRRLTERRLRLAELEPRYQSLNRDRDVLQSSVRDFAMKAEQSQASQQIAAATNDDIRIVERAAVPARGRSLRGPVLLLSLLFAAVSALCAGLARTHLRPGLPSSASAARTFDLPVLGSAALKQPA
ncbi:MAG: lipopolysaccharide biosynthesis protein [Caulobacteraceae bacterium]|nr:lipopolysaccharide biosynthesis protein [Caulobacteraceae bacterium]